MAKTLDHHDYTTIDATIIADSLSPQGHRLTSYVLTMPRIVLAEFNTHRALSRNSASSRAIPFTKMVEMAKDNPFIPIGWQKDHSGMQGKEYLTGREQFDLDGRQLGGQDAARELWLRGRDAAVEYATKLNIITGVTKQICNRMLEPYLYHTVIATGSEWENFFALRAEDAAEIHIQDLAYKMLAGYNASTPIPLKSGEWHIPFGDNINDEERLTELADHAPVSSMIPEHLQDIKMLKVKIATARCARVSYLNFHGKDNYEADIRLHGMLANMGHWSPMEHCARAMTDNEYRYNVSGELENMHIEKNLVEGGRFEETYIEDSICGWSGNFRGFIQLRKLYEDENKIDPRVK